MDPDEEIIVMPPLATIPVRLVVRRVFIGRPCCPDLDNDTDEPNEGDE